MCNPPADINQHDSGFFTEVLLIYTSWGAGPWYLCFRFSPAGLLRQKSHQETQKVCIRWLRKAQVQHTGWLLWNGAAAHCTGSQHSPQDPQPVHPNLPAPPCQKGVRGQSPGWWQHALVLLLSVQKRVWGTRTGWPVSTLRQQRWDAPLYPLWSHNPSLKLHGVSAWVS